jgi:hypothetical protein
MKSRIKEHGEILATLEGHIGKFVRERNFGDSGWIDCIKFAK